MNDKNLWSSWDPWLYLWTHLIWPPREDKNDSRIYDTRNAEMKELVTDSSNALQDITEFRGFGNRPLDTNITTLWILCSTLPTPVLQFCSSYRYQLYLQLLQPEHFCDWMVPFCTLYLMNRSFRYIWQRDVVGLLQMYVVTGNAHREHQRRLLASQEGSVRATLA